MDDAVHSETDDTAACLRQLVGTWDGSGQGRFPTIDDFTYREVLTVLEDADAGLLHYVQETWRNTADGEAASHRETGFIGVDDSGLVTILNAQGTDRVEALSGRIHLPAPGTGEWRLDLSSSHHGHDARMRSATRAIRLVGDELDYEMSMATDRVASLTTHLAAHLARRPSDDIG